MDDYNESGKQEDDRAERSREEGDEIEQGNHLQENQREGARELHDAGERKRIQEGTVITEPQNGIDEDRERRCHQGGHGTGTGCLGDDALEVHCHHWPSSHLVAMMPRMKTTAAKTPMTAASFSAARLSTNTMDARSPSFT